MTKHKKDNTCKANKAPCIGIINPAKLSKDPTVSVQMITYNQEPYIAQAIEGVLMQKTDLPFELIIGEDCSTDHTRTIVLDYQKKYPGLIRVITSDNNVGMMNNSLRTMVACRGKYIALCEGDDYWTDPCKLQKQVDFLEANPEYGMISSDINLIDIDSKPLPENDMILLQRKYRKPDVTVFDLLQINSINTLTVCVRANILKTLSERIIRENLWFVFDYWFWLNVALKSKIRITYEKTAAYRIHDAGISRQNGFLNCRSPLIYLEIINTLLEKKTATTIQEKNIIIRHIIRLLFSKHISLAQKQKLLIRSLPYYEIFVSILSKKLTHHKDSLSK